MERIRENLKDEHTLIAKAVSGVKLAGDTHCVDRSGKELYGRIKMLDASCALLSAECQGQPGEIFL